MPWRRRVHAFARPSLRRICVTLVLRQCFRSTVCRRCDTGSLMRSVPSNAPTTRPIVTPSRLSCRAMVDVGQEGGLVDLPDFLRARESGRTRARAQSLREYRVTSCKFRIFKKVL